MREKKPLSLMIIIFTLSLFCSYHIYYHFADVTNGDLVKTYYKRNEEETKSQSIVKKMNLNNEEQYLGILSIPKINLKTGFYNINSKNNNVNSSVTLLRESIMPDENGSIIYLAAHSGSGYLAYFKDLDKLSEGDIISISYNRKDYQYIINNIYEMPKTGEIAVNHNINEKCLILTTCSKNKNMQLIIFAKMLNQI